MPKKVSEISGCNGCPMQRLFSQNNFVPPKAGDGRRLIIAEAPGEVEAAMGEPLVGGSGRVCQSLYSKAGIPWDSCTKINTIQCRPPENDFPTDSKSRYYITAAEAQQAVDHCYKAHVEPLIKAGNWERIDLLGEKALRACTNTKGTITKWRGSIMEVKALPGQEIAVPTFHPSYLMKNQSEFPVVVSDLKKSLVQPPENYDLYPSLETVKAFNATTFALDIETNRFTNEIRMVGLCVRPFYAICIPFKGAYIPEIKRIFSSANVIVGHNLLQFDLPTLKNVGVVVSPNAQIWDTMLCHHLIQPDLAHDLEYVASIFTNKPAWKHLSDENTELYCCRDVDVTFQIWQQLLPLLRQFKLENVYKNISWPLAKICRLMQVQGFKIDPGQVKRVRERLLEMMKSEESYLPDKLKTQTVPINRRIAAPPGTLGKSGKPVRFISVPSSKDTIPWRSNKAVADWLYKDLALPKQKHIKTDKVTTDKIAIDRLYRLSNWRRDILAVRNLRSIDENITTFTKEKLMQGMAVHSSFNVHGTNSGRLSSSEPNVQNIPEEVRCIYIPRHADWLIMQADYSSIENRLTAWFAQDSDRLIRFNQLGFNEHKYAASVFFDIPYDKVIKDSDKNAPYGKAKRIVHGSNYGMGARKIAKMYDLDEGEVREFLKKWKATIWRTIEWQERTAAQAKSDGYLTNPFGRKRWFYTSSYYTEALSFLPQSTAADIILRAMIGLYYDRIDWPLENVYKVCHVAEALPKSAELNLQVHDCLVFNFPAAWLQDIYGIVTKVMTQPWSELGGFSCPISIEVGKNWGPHQKGGDLQPYDGN